MKKQINDLLLKLQTGESYIGETTNALLNLFVSSSQLNYSFKKGDTVIYNSSYEATVIEDERNRLVKIQISKSKPVVVRKSNLELKQK